LEEHGAWAEANYDPLETEFMDKLKNIEGTSLHEVQESEYCLMDSNLNLYLGAVHFGDI
jgi:hypothetical protein